VPIGEDDLLERPLFTLVSVGLSFELIISTTYRPTIPKPIPRFATSTDVHDEYVPEETFGACIDALLQVCVEVLLERDGAVLVARRTNEPAKGEWFWPGGRLYKGERLDDAARRVAREELDVEVDLTERFGVYRHFWDTASVEGADSRHTVNIVYRATQSDSDAEVALDDQHDDYRFATGDEDDLYEYVRRYLADVDDPGR
jgi:colanic acid biosynthesis protein WcaH